MGEWREGREVGSHCNGKGVEFTLIIEQDEDGYFVATMPELKGWHTQARSLDELMERVKEAIELCLEEGRDWTVGPEGDIKSG